MTENILQSLKWRYAVKKFDSTRKIPSQDWEILESSLILSPSGYGLQPWKFLVIQDPVLRKKLTPESLNQEQIEDCSHLIVFAAKTSVDENYIERHVEKVAEIRKVPRETLRPYYQMMADDLLAGPKSKYLQEWAARQTYIALGTLLSTAAFLRIDACPLEGIIPERYDEILNLRFQGYRTLLACALGYRNPDDKYARFGKVRFDRDQVIQHL